MCVPPPRQSPNDSRLAAGPVTPISSTATADSGATMPRHRSILDSVERETWLPHSLPQRHRLPAAATRNVTAYFASDHGEHVYPAAEYFMEYNPSIVVLPEAQTRQLVSLASDGNSEGE